MIRSCLLICSPVGADNGGSVNTWELTLKKTHPTIVHVLGLGWRASLLCSLWQQWRLSKATVFNFWFLLSAFLSSGVGEVNCPSPSTLELASWALRAERSVWGQSVITAWDGMPRGAGDHWTFLWQRGFTTKLPGHFYQAVVNGYDMICLASFLIKAYTGNVTATASHFTEAQ